ncbi:MAG: bifunctional homocysteine S-methyltransferase/methylenetetrahydrofolate reductase [Candidatus Eremiobacterota bacterium]
MNQPVNTRRDILQAIRQRVLVADGAMGTRLQGLRGAGQDCLDALNVDPILRELVAAVHRSYLDVGADILLTNTYGANAIKLGRHGLGDQVKAINTEGVRLARRCAGEDRLVGGSVGPLEIHHIRHEYEENEVEAIFHEQMSALVEAGVDFLALETFQSLYEARAALLEAMGFGIPVMFEVGGAQNGRTGTGADVREFALLANRLGANLLGANCRGPYDVLETIGIMAQFSELPLVAMPNAGSPEIDRGRVVYHVQPEQFYTYGKRLVAAGACVVGGCCGTEPEHIAELKRAVEGLEPPRERHISSVRVLEASGPAAEQVREENPVAKVFREVDFILSVEMRPNREAPLTDFIQAGRELASQGVHLFDVPDNAGAKVTVDPLVAAAEMQRETRIPTMIHLSACSRNLVAVQSYLLGAWHAGIRGILAVTGDHPNVGDHDKYASRVNDLKSSVNLMRLIGSLNQGRLFNQAGCCPCNFFIGGGFNPGRGHKAQLKWLEQKVEAGARFIYTQPVYRELEVDQMLESTAHLDVPILVGVLPITSRRNAEFFAAGKIPGIVVPEEILQRYEKVQGLEDAQRLARDLTLDLLDRIRKKIRGVYLIPPFGKTRYQMVSEIISNVR